MILGVSNGEWNKVESSNGVLIVHEEGQIGSTKKVLNKTWQEIHDAGFSVLKMENMDGSGFNMLYIHEVFYNEIDGYVVSYGSLPSGGFAYFTNRCHCLNIICNTH